MIGFQNEAAPSAASPTLADRIEKVFAAGGLLQRHLGLDHRPQQEKMALAVADAFESNKPLLFEAGTGVGKSLAYLLPGLIRAVDTQRQMVVSTATISLQEQIYGKDLPLCREFFAGVPSLKKYAEFRQAILLGKSNYLCTLRLGQARQAQQELFRSEEALELERVLEWSRGMEHGLRHEINPPPDPLVWEWVNADSSTCNRHNCSPTACPYQRARAAIENANVIIVNHSLLFALIGAGIGNSFKTPGVIFPGDFLVIDEAHSVPDIATDHFGLRISSTGLDRLLKALFNPRANRGLLARYGSPNDRLKISDAIEQAERFFEFAKAKLLTQRPRARVRESGWCDPFLLPYLRDALDVAARIADRLDDGPARTEMQDQRNRLKSYADGIASFIDLAAKEHVHWAERSGQRGIVLQTAPLDVAPDIDKSLFRRKTSVVLTSATLAIGGGMEIFQQRAGAVDVDARIENSPFDFERAMRAYVARDVPLPSIADARLAIDALADYILFCIQRVDGGAMALFTSYADMNKLAGMIEEELTRTGRTLFVQGRDFSRTEITRRFKEAKNAVLFGTESFWTGVDIPGPALSMVIVTRLPFENPSHPVAEAKCECIRSRGGNPFSEYTLPEALIKFRQGVGRLIRTKNDRGIIAILDSRVIVKQYGRLFLASLPTSRYFPMTRANREKTFHFP